MAERHDAVTIGYGRDLSQPEQSSRKLFYAMDDFANQFLDAPDTEEAQSWLHGVRPNQVRTLGEHDSAEESIALVKNFYAAGAVRVLAVDIDRDEEHENTGRLLIELPHDASDRASVLAIVDNVARSVGFDSEPDLGQSYAFVMLD